MDLSHRDVALSTKITLHVREGGAESPAVLFLHGWTVPGAVWDPVVARWPANTSRVLVPDLRGTGWSTKPREGYALTDDVGDVVALIDELKLDDIVLVGHSKGGAIAQRVAVERPGALRTLVLVAPVPSSGVPLPDPAVAGLRSLCGHRAGAIRLVKDILAKPVAADLFEPLIESIASVCTESQLGGFDAFRTANFADVVQRITTPTFVIAGGEDPVLPLSLIRPEVVERIPGATLRILEGCGHYPQLEATEELTSALLEIVAASRPRAR